MASVFLHTQHQSGRWCHTCLFNADDARPAAKLQGYLPSQLFNIDGSKYGNKAAGDGVSALVGVCGQKSSEGGKVEIVLACSAKVKRCQSCSSWKEHQ